MANSIRQHQRVYQSLKKQLLPVHPSPAARLRPLDLLNGSADPQKHLWRRLHRHKLPANVPIRESKSPFPRSAQKANSYQLMVNSIEAHQRA